MIYIIILVLLYYITSTLDTYQKEVQNTKSVSEKGNPNSSYSQQYFQLITTTAMIHPYTHIYDYVYYNCPAYHKEDDNSCFKNWMMVQGIALLITSRFYLMQNYLEH